MQATLGQGAALGQPIPGEGENYIATSDSAVKQAAVEQVSTFSIDVDTGAYSNVRRFLMNGQLPPKDAAWVYSVVGIALLGLLFRALYRRRIFVRL